WFHLLSCSKGASGTMSSQRWMLAVCFALASVFGTGEFVATTETQKYTCKTFGSGVVQPFSGLGYYVRSNCPFTLTRFTHNRVECDITAQRGDSGLLVQVEIIMNKVRTVVQNGSIRVERKRVSLPYDHTYQHIFQYGIYTKLRSSLLPLSVTWHNVPGGIDTLMVELEQEVSTDIVGLCGKQSVPAPQSCPGDLHYVEQGAAFIPSCSNPNPRFSNQELSSSCVCPMGTVLNDHADGFHCVSPSSCSCVFAGSSYLTGDIRDTKCQSCVCEGGKWHCSDNVCPARCLIEGQFVTTFDGKQYALPGKCTYVVSQGFNWTVTIQFSEKETSLKTVVLQLSQEVYTFSLNSVKVGDEEISELHQSDHALVFWQSSTHVQVQTFFGLKIQVQMSPEIQLYITPPRNHTGIISEIFADEKCSVLNNPTGIFAKCHSHIPTDQFHAACIQRTCNCGSNLQQCLCVALSSYAKACAVLGVVVGDWRKATNCTLTCQKNQEFFYDVRACNHTCRSLSGPDPRCWVDDAPVEGCGCPEGTHLNQGCKNGKVCVHCSEFPVNTAQKTCYSLSKPLSASTTCESGCYCPHDQFEDHHGNCVSVDNCTCVYSGKVFSAGQHVKTNCKTCVCGHGQWHCRDEPCPGKCQVYGNGHYQTFDSKWYRFDGHCQYTLVEDYCGTGNGTFSVRVESVPCCDEVLTCSRAIILDLQVGDSFIDSHSLHKDTEPLTMPLYQSILMYMGCTVNVLPHPIQGFVTLTLSDMKVTRRLQKGWTLQEDSLYTTHTVGLYIIISVPSKGITLIWDKHTRITIELHPNWRNHVCGLCGNFDSNEMNDLQISGSAVVSSPMAFGNSWKADTPPCSDVTTEMFPCERNSYCSAWAQRRCMIITADIFKECHLKVDPGPYYHACVQESCSCEFEGKFLGFCTAVAAYAEACSDQDVCVKWRTPDLCPVYCDYYNEQGQCSWHYDPCGQMLTCGKSNHFTHKLEGRCELYGDPHYISFDGVTFDFLDSCTYVLVEEQSPQHNLSIAVDNFYCVQGLPGSCAKGVILKYQNNVATLSVIPALFTVQATLNNMTILPPYEEHGLRFETTGYIVSIYLPEIRSYISLSPFYTLVVSLAMEHFHNNTQGQCDCKGPQGEPKMPGDVWQSNCNLCTCNNQTRTEECFPKPVVVPLCSPTGVLVNTSCCGEQICVEKSCNYNGKTYKVGDTWKDPTHPCVSLSCTTEGVQTQTRVCPTENCPEEDRIWDNQHCCFTCNQSCTPKLSSFNITLDNCTTVIEMPVCQGQCLSQPSIRVVSHGDLQVEQQSRSCQESSEPLNLPVLLFLASMACVYFAKAFGGAYMKSSITQIERRFDIPSSLIGVIDGSFEMGLCSF
ncbi:hypothetical protein INR49_031538, partial [Caranx melampygus]